MTDVLVGPADFARLAARRIEQIPGIHVTGGADLQLQLVVQRRSVAVDITHFYDLYCSDPASIDQILQALVENSVAFPPDRTITDPARLLGQIMPMLKPIALLNTVHEQKLPMLAYRPFIADLIITYVVDEGERAAFINRDHLAAWGVDEHVVHKHALENLAQRARPPRIIGSGTHRLLLHAHRDGYDATRLLLPGSFEPFARRLSGQIVIGIPTRDLLIAFGDQDPIFAAEVSRQVVVDAATGPFPLTERLLTIRDGSVQLYQQE